MSTVDRFRHCDFLKERIGRFYLADPFADPVAAAEIFANFIPSQVDWEHKIQAYAYVGVSPFFQRRTSNHGFPEYTWLRLQYLSPFDRATVTALSAEGLYATLADPAFRSRATVLSMLVPQLEPRTKLESLSGYPVGHFPARLAAFFLDEPMVIVGDVTDRVEIKGKAESERIEYVSPVFRPILQEGLAAMIKATMCATLDLGRLSAQELAGMAADVQATLSGVNDSDDPSSWTDPSRTLVEPSAQASPPEPDAPSGWRQRDPLF
jgi:hypothetical protein